MKNNVYIIIVASMFLLSCSVFQESESNKTDESQNVYVFDDISVKDSSDNVAEELPPTTTIATQELSPSTTIVAEDSLALANDTQSVIEMYIVQVGAFSTKEKAETFVLGIKNKTNYELNTYFSDLVGLYVIQLPPFRTREEAEKVRDELRKIKELEGTFIVPKNK